MKLFALAKYSKLIEKTCFRRVFTWTKKSHSFLNPFKSKPSVQASIEIRANIEYFQFTSLSISRGQNDKFRLPFSHLTFAMEKKWKLITFFSSLYLNFRLAWKTVFIFRKKEHCNSNRGKRTNVLKQRTKSFDESWSHYSGLNTFVCR